MQKLIYLLVLIVGLSCQDRTVKDKDSEIILKNLSEKESFSKNDSIDSDDIILVINNLDTVWFYRTDLHFIEKEFPEITSQFQILHPDIAYSKSRNDNGSSQKNEYFKENFSSLAGQDYYYRLYAYYLKNRNKSSVYQNESNTLNNLLILLNDFMSIKAGGGSYYAHRYARIPAYVEFEVYKLNSTSHFLTQLNMKKKKEFIKMLKIKEKINEEIAFELVGLTRQEIRDELANIILTIDKLIINDFYLNRCLNFFQIEE
ncbi:hypothetical protein [Lutibacter sp.]|uniref:hypothetical protein n=1 Tax=Lutibacter sp. TaxID=1925666 RepID=UPI00273545AE|nr:hypothetical protein [Lutibacter sp.]MDP3313718.1 hypothetical protein [Lutibacter sp.]